MDLPAISGVQHAEGGEREGERERERERGRVVPAFSQLCALNQVAHDARPHRIVWIFDVVDAITAHHESLSLTRYATLFCSTVKSDSRTLRAVSHCDEKGWWHVLDGKGCHSFPPESQPCFWSTGRDVGKLAAVAARLLQGKHRGLLRKSESVSPTWHPRRSKPQCQVFIGSSAAASIWLP